MVAKIDVIGIGNAGQYILRLSRRNRQHFAGPGHGQWTQQQSIDETEHRRIRAGSQGERQHSHQRECRVLPEHADGITQILKVGHDKRVIGILTLSKVADLYPRAACGLVSGSERDYLRQITILCAEGKCSSNSPIEQQHEIF